MNPNVPLEPPVWKYEGSERRPIFISAMYDDLETNLPHSLMRFSDVPFPKGTQLFPHRDEVLRYLDEYGRQVHELIHFRTQVLDVRSISLGKRQSWIVTTKDLETERVAEAEYDAVVVANGHYNVPRIPNIKGISAWNEKYPGAILHSKFYRTPERFRDKVWTPLDSYLRSL